jgi:hypothetical protein
MKARKFLPAEFSISTISGQTLTPMLGEGFPTADDVQKKEMFS